MDGDVTNVSMRGTISVARTGYLCPVTPKAATIDTARNSRLITSGARPPLVTVDRPSSAASRNSRPTYYTPPPPPAPPPPSSLSSPSHHHPNNPSWTRTKPLPTWSQSPTSTVLPNVEARSKRRIPSRDPAPEDRGRDQSAASSRMLAQCRQTRSTTRPSPPTTILQMS